MAGYDSQGAQSALGESDRRMCTICNFEGHQVEATHVAGDGNGLQWFECGKHGPTDHPMAEPRTNMVPLADYLRAVRRRAQGYVKLEPELRTKFFKAEAAIAQLRATAGPPGRPKPDEVAEPDIRQWPVPSCLSFQRWRALLHRAAGLKLKRSAEIFGVTPEKLRHMYVDIMKSCGFEPGTIGRDDINDHWSKNTCPSIKTAHYVMTQVCDREGLPIPYFEGREEGLPW